MADAVQIFFDGFLVRSADVVEDVAGLMGPAALHGDLAIDERQRSQQSLASIGNDQLEGFSLESPAVQIVEKGFPVRLFFGRRLIKVDDFLFAVGADP